ncbi:hypothetical protein [Ereboglobus luteus]|uniref:Uncharacterized protein n=1 Tax=Ereboglobus luteus TaxID=1796921 RepID=A0A2U8E1R8_9BACT|nr:hypothetical protein [Ereboglobus luteus]AWI08735.1 hypothetical protein CKA38_05225 [Ereboglobus luteus]
MSKANKTSLGSEIAALKAIRRKRDESKKIWKSFEAESHRLAGELDRKKWFIAGRELLAEAEDDDDFKKQMLEILNQRLRFAKQRKLFGFLPLQERQPKTGESGKLPNIASGGEEGQK